MRLKILLFICCLFTCKLATAQGSRKSDRFYQSALRYKAKKQPDKACRRMSKAISKAPSSPDAYSVLGEWYFQAHRFREAADVFKTASRRVRNGGRQFAKPYAKCLIYAGYPDAALSLIASYAGVKDSAEWNYMRRQATFAVGALARPWTDTVSNLGPRINTTDAEFFPCMAVDSQHLYYTRRVNNQDEDLYVADRDTCAEWWNRHDIGDPPNSPDQELAQFISADGHYLFFTRCENRSVDSWTDGGCDLFMAYRTANDSDWTIAQPFGSTINTPDYEGQPSLSPDNHELYFVSDRAGGYGGYDIWVSRFEDGLWQQPVNAGPSVNTPGNETAPYINLDNKTLYFTSDGWPGLGGTDIFMCRRALDTTWTPAVNLGYPINSAYDEKSECVTLDGKKLFFASDRQGPAGNFDLYETPLPGALKPIPVSYLQGYVYDSLSKNRLNYAVIYISNARTGDTIYQFQSNRGDGSFLITLHLGITYAIHTYRLYYTATDDTVVFDKQYLDRPLVRNISMLPSDYVKPINDSMLAMLHFDVMSVALSDSDQATIRDAISPWLQEKGYMIFVNAYTDNTGTPMINEELSHRRAGLVAKYITGMGIDPTMVQAKGLGEAHMIASNETEEGQRKNRRVEIIIRR